MRFHSLAGAESAAPVRNPDRGWYEICPYCIEHNPSQVCLTLQYPLTLLEVNLKAYRNEALPDAALENLRTLLARFRDAGSTLILRPLYDWEGRCFETEPEAFEQILAHIAQLGTVLRDFAETILLIQGVLLGNWAEMHTSPHLTQENVRRLIAALDQAVEGKICLSVRTPAYRRSVLLSDQAETPAPLSRRLSVYNDALFSSETDLGTYGVPGSQETGLSKKRDPEFERAYLREVSRFAPIGGETAALCSENTGARFLQNLWNLPLSYLNAQHCAEVLNQWRDASCAQRGPFRGMSCFDTIGALLGYRLFLKSARFHRGTLSLTLENRGTAPLYRRYPCELIRVRPDGQSRISIGCDTRSWQSRIEMSLPLLPVEGERIYLRIGNIRLVNQNIYDEALGANLIGEFR